MSFEQAHTLLNRQGQIVSDFDPVMGYKDSLGRGYSTTPVVSVPILAGSAANGFIWTCHEGIWRVGSVSEAHTVVGGASCAVTVVVCPQSVAVGSGTAQLIATLDLTVTAPAARFGTMIATPTLLTRGDSVAYLLSGTQTGLVGVLTVMMWRMG